MEVGAHLDDHPGRLRRFRLTHNEALDIWIEQDGTCPICLDPLGLDFHIDHDHETDGVRGFLCPTCNTSRVGANTLRTARRVVDYLQGEQRGLPGV